MLYEVLSHVLLSPTTDFLPFLLFGHRFCPPDDPITCMLIMSQQTKNQNGLICLTSSCNSYYSKILAVINYVISQHVRLSHRRSIHFPHR